MAPLRYLVVSLGNQAPYYDCLHSAGHFALASAQKALAPSQPRFTSQRYGKRSCLVSAAEPYIFVQSPTQMNVSGPWISTAWRDALSQHSLQPSELALVLVHDELEAAFCTVRTRKWDASHRGQRGVKSAQMSLNPLQKPLRVGQHWARISVGIGRPAGRTPEEVSAHVLRTVKSHEKEMIDAKVGSLILRCLFELRGEWERS
ncbi:peptidyl-tRNA hydrolase [Astrocystis sublimbata]|nr:peptidyl-tRNA hydrolase [Astrocystis sublimbata]